jgi:hypothetical protein
MHPNPDGHHTQIHDHLHVPSLSDASILEVAGPGFRVDSEKEGWIW